jgi:hypothetical protein
MCVKLEQQINSPLSFHLLWPHTCMSIFFVQWISPYLQLFRKVSAVDTVPFWIWVNTDTYTRRSSILARLVVLFTCAQDSLGTDHSCPYRKVNTATPRGSDRKWKIIVCGCDRSITEHAIKHLGMKTPVVAAANMAVRTWKSNPKYIQWANMVRQMTTTYHILHSYHEIATSSIQILFFLNEPHKIVRVSLI